VRERRGTSEEILFLAGNGCGLRDEINFSKRKAFRSVFKLFSSLHLCENIGLSTGTYRYYSTVLVYILYCTVVGSCSCLQFTFIKNLGIVYLRRAATHVCMINTILL
jgi:hypothetical protein